MGLVKGSKWNKNMILKAWRSIEAGIGNKRSLFKANSKPLRDENGKGQIVPNGCFSVYVGPQKQRFVVKTEYVNHPLFMMLLEEAELEYGFKNDGPILLPCNVDLFNKVMAEMNGEEEDMIHGSTGRSCRSFTQSKGLSFLVLLSAACSLCYMNKGHSAYCVIDSEMMKINTFQ